MWFHEVPLTLWTHTTTHSKEHRRPADMTRPGR